MEQKDYRLAAIMFTDIHGFSRMMEKDEAGTLKLLHFHNQLVGDIVKAHNGTIIKTIGDALLVDFKNTVEALQSALEVQAKLYEYNKEHRELPLLLRIGVHLGDIYFFENDALGEGINIASRLQSIATPGAICISGDVYNLVLNKIDFHAERLGKVSLKNISKEVHAYEIATPNVEFNPDKDKPRMLHPDPDFEKANAEAQNKVGEMVHSWTPGSRPEERAKPVGAQDSGTQGSRAESAGSASSAQAEQIKREILGDMKTAGRRFTEEEVWRRYSSLGDVARGVIADLASKGLLQRSPGQGQFSQSGAGNGQNSNNASGAFKFGFFGGSNENSGLNNLANILPPHVYEKLARIESKIEESVNRAIDQSGGARGAPPFPRPPFGPSGDGRMERHEYRAARRAERWESQAASKSPENNYIDFESYKQRTIQRGKRAWGGFLGHLIPFLAVNAFLIFLNVTIAGPFPWCLFPLFGWGIGLTEHYGQVLCSRRKAEEVQKMPDLDRQQLGLYKKLNQAEDSVVYHGISTVTVSTLLIVTNVITSMAFFWAAIPVAALVLSFLPHLASFKSRRAELRKALLSSLGISGSWKDIFRMAGKGKGPITFIPPGPCRDAYNEAIRLKAAIVEQVKTAGQKGSPVDKDMLPALDSYVQQVQLLAARTAEVEQIIDSIPMKDLESDKAELVSKRDAAPSESLKREYQKSLDEIEKHGKSFDDLKNQKEVLYLRLKSSVNNLKQMQIDFARVATMSNAQSDNSALRMVVDKTSELSSYMQALKDQPMDAFDDFDQRLADALDKDKPKIEEEKAEDGK